MPGPTTGILSNFNFTEDPLSTDFGEPFSSFFGEWAADGSEAVVSGLANGQAWAYYSAGGPYPVPCEVSVLIPTLNGNGDTFSLFLADNTTGGAGFDGYFLELIMASGADTVNLKKLTDGVDGGTLATTTQAFSAGDGLLLLANPGSNSIKLDYYNGSSWSNLLSGTDSDYTNNKYILFGTDGTTITLDDLRGGESSLAIGLDPSDLSSAATIGALSLGRLRRLVLSSLSSAITIDNETISRVRQLLLSDLSSASSITALSIAVFKLLIPSAVTSATSIDAESVARIRQLIAGDLNLSTEMNALSLTRTRQLLMGAVSSASTIEDLVITVGGVVALLVNSMSSSTIVGDEVLNRIRKLTIADLSSSAQMTQSVLTRLRQLGFQDVQANTVIEDLPISIVGAVLGRREDGMLLKVY